MVFFHHSTLNEGFKSVLFNLCSTNSKASVAASLEVHPCSGAGTNLKVGAPVRSESGEAPIRAGKFFLVVPLHVLALKAQLVVLVSAFVMVSTVWSVSCSLFFYSPCPPCPAICKSGGTCPPSPMESAPLHPWPVTI